MSLFDLASQNLLSPMVLFFVLGLLAAVVVFACGARVWAGVGWVGEGVGRSGGCNGVAMSFIVCQPCALRVGVPGVGAAAVPGWAHRPWPRPAGPGRLARAC